MNKSVVIIGAGGHAKVIADIIIKSGDKVYGFLDDNKDVGTKVIEDYAVVGKVEDCVKLQKENEEFGFVIAIGSNNIRKMLNEKYHNLNYYTAIHPNAVIGMQVKIDKGTIVMANACINPNAKIGKHCIINTAAIVEHDNIIEDYVHLSPNATLCGTVTIGEGTHIGAGAIVKNNTSVTQDCIVGAGAVVVKNIGESGTYVGVPAKGIKGKSTL